MTEKKTVQANFNFDITKLANQAAQQEITTLKAEIKELTKSHSIRIDRLHKELSEAKKERNRAQDYRSSHEYTKAAANEAAKNIHKITAQLQEIFKNIRSKQMGALIDYVDNLCNKDIFLNMESDIDALISDLKFLNSKIKNIPTKKEKK